MYKEDINMFKNLTGHNVVILFDDSPSIVIEPEKTGAASLVTSVRFIKEDGGIPMTKIVIDDIKNLPEEQENVYFIVDNAVKTALLGRSDLVVVEGIERDENGNVKGCRSLSF